MKKIGFVIALMLICITTVVIGVNAQSTPKSNNVRHSAEEVVVIRAVSLSDLIGSDDEAECFSYYYKHDIALVKINIQQYRSVYETEICDAGYNYKSDYTHVKFPVPFSEDGKIVTWSQFTNIHKHSWNLKPGYKIIGKHAEKTTFFYDLEEE
jgi:hypothetical protein